MGFPLGKRAAAEGREKSDFEDAGGEKEMLAVSGN